jgi:hypothetical protein
MRSVSELAFSPFIVFKMKKKQNACIFYFAEKQKQGKD